MHLQKTFDHVMLPEDLGDTTIALIGLLEMGYTNVTQIAGFMHVRDLRQLRKLLRMLKTSKNPVVRRCVDEGLPPGMMRPFPYSGSRVRCPACHNLVNCVPCQCGRMTKRKAWLRQGGRDSSSKEDPLNRTPTIAYPGTREKLAIMRRRAERGQPLFHPDDAPLVPRGF